MIMCLMIMCQSRMPHPPLIINVSTLVQGTIETTGGEEPVFFVQFVSKSKIVLKKWSVKKKP